MDTQSNTTLLNIKPAIAYLPQQSYQTVQKRFSGRGKSLIISKLHSSSSAQLKPTTFFIALGIKTPLLPPSSFQNSFKRFGSKVPPISSILTKGSKGKTTEDLLKASNPSLPSSSSSPSSPSSTGSTGFIKYLKVFLFSSYALIWTYILFRNQGIFNIVDPFSGLSLDESFSFGITFSEFASIIENSPRSNYRFPMVCLINILLFLNLRQRRELFLLRWMAIGQTDQKNAKELKSKKHLSFGPEE